MLNFDNIPLRDILKQSLRLINDSQHDKWIINNDDISGIRLPLNDVVNNFEKAHQMVGQDYCRIGMCLRGSSFLRFVNQNKDKIEQRIEDRIFEFNSDCLVVALPGEIIEEFTEKNGNYTTLWVCLSQTETPIVYLFRKYTDESEFLYNFCNLENSQEQNTVIDSIICEINKGKTCSLNKLIDNIKKIVMISYQLLYDKEIARSPRRANKSELVDQIKKIISENYTTRIRVDDISKKIHASTSYLQCIFKEITGRTITQYIEYLRIANARECLKSTGQNIRSIALQLGYYDECHFSKSFKKETGYSPAHYRKHKGVFATPELPWEYNNTEYVNPSSKKISVYEGNDLQAALDAAMPGDMIVLQAGAVFTGNYTLPKKDKNEWIYIQSSDYSKMPEPGNRISPSNAVNMPKIVTTKTSTLAAITITRGAHHYRFSGIEITCAHDTTTAVLTAIVNIQCDNNSDDFYASDIPHDIIFDRCYIHGTATGNLKRGIAISGMRISVIDSYISECHDMSDGSQAILCYNGPGPIKIVNNHLESSGENILLGGKGSLGASLNPSDIEIRSNYFYKPFSWHLNHDSYNKIHWVIKNLFEIKNAQRVLLDGNIFENCWVDEQAGYAIWIKLEDELDTNWHVCEDITFTNNIIRNSASGLTITGYAAVGRSGSHNWGRRMLIKNNLIYNAEKLNIGTGGGIFIKIKNNFSDLTIEHNTSINYGSIILCDGLPSYNFIFRNNICSSIWQSNKIKGVDHGGGIDTLNYYFPGYEFEKNAINGCKETDYPAGNFISETADYEFLNYIDYDQLFDVSKYRYLGTDGMDIGADFESIISCTHINK